MKIQFEANDSRILQNCFCFINFLVIFAGKGSNVSIFCHVQNTRKHILLKNLVEALLFQQETEPKYHSFRLLLSSIAIFLNCTDN